MTDADSVRFNARSDDPTASKTLRSTFARQFRGRWRELRGLNRDYLRQLPDSVEEPRLLSSYRQWVQGAIQSTVVEPMAHTQVRRGTHWTGTHVRQAYRKGLRLATRDLETAGYPSERVARATKPTVREHRRHRERALLGAYLETEDVGERMRHSVTEAMSEQMQQAQSGRVIADETNEAIRSSGPNATNALANTAVVETINEALLTSFELTGVEQVGVQVESVGSADVRSNAGDTDSTHANTRSDRLRLNKAGEVVWETAMDKKVCSECMALEGAILKIPDIRGTGFQPPIHPNCRCKLVPMPMTIGDEDIPVPESFS